MSTVCSDVVKVVTFLDFQLSQGNVAKYCGSVGNGYGVYIVNFLANQLVKNFENPSIFAKVINKR